MATPKRGDKMISRLMRLNVRKKADVPKFDEEAEYRHLKWDFEHGQLPQNKNERYNLLKEKYAK